MLQRVPRARTIQNTDIFKIEIQYPIKTRLYIDPEFGPQTQFGLKPRRTQTLMIYVRRSENTKS